MRAEESVDVRTAGATLSIRIHPGSGAPIVLLHGGPGFGDHLAPIAGMLSPPHHVVRYDQRGCGKSSRESSCTFGDHVEDLNDLRKYLGAETIHLFGHSWGGLLAQLYAKSYPQHVASLALCCAAANTGRKFAEIEQRAIDENIIRKVRSPRSLVWFLASYVPGLGDVGFQHLIRLAYPHYFVRPERAPEMEDASAISRSGYLDTQRSIDRADEHLLATIPLDAPVLILQGRQDVLAATNAIIAGRFPHARREWIEDAGHFLWEEQFESVRSVLTGFYGG